MASGPCLRRCRVVRRYMPTKKKRHRDNIKSYALMQVSMDLEPFLEGNALNTRLSRPKVPIHRKLGPGGVVPAPAPERHVGQVRGAGRRGTPRLGAPVAGLAPPTRPSPRSAAGERLAVSPRFPPAAARFVVLPELLLLGKALAFLYARATLIDNVWRSLA